MRTLDLRDLRLAGGVMLAGAAVQPWLGHFGGLPCPLRAVTGIPCPFCGMTTSVVATTRLRLDDALSAAPVGVLAVVAAVVLLARPRLTSVRIPVAAVPAGLVAMWLFQLSRFGFL